jgi:hypothetical protein
MSLSRATKQATQRHLITLNSNQKNRASREIAVWELLSELDNPRLFVKSLIWATPLYLFGGKLFFRDWGGFLDALRFLYQPTWLSALRGEWHDDNWASLKFFLYLAYCLACADVLYRFLGEHLHTA